MPSRVVPPHDTKLPISDGDWLLIRTRLNHGEQQAAFARMYNEGKYDPLRSPMAVVTAYLLDWSLTGLDDKPLNIRNEPIEVVEAALNAIDPASFDEIKRAIDVHEQRMIAARTAEKKMTVGASADSTTSASPSAADGASNGSAN